MQSNNIISMNKSRIFAIIIFVLFITARIIPPLNRFLSVCWHKFVYMFFGNSFYFSFWFFIFNQIILPPLLLGLVSLLTFQVKHFPKVIVYFICLLAVFLMGIIQYRKDLKNVLNDNYVVEKVSIYELAERRGKWRRGFILPRYGLTAYGNRSEEMQFYEIDIIGYKTILEHKRILRQEFMQENPYDPYQDVASMSEYEFDVYIESYRGYKFEKWQDKMELTIYYLPDRGFIFKYKFEK